MWKAKEKVALNDRRQITADQMSFVHKMAFTFELFCVQIHHSTNGSHAGIGQAKHENSGTI